MGSMPIVMSSGETYEALTRGQLDVVLTSFSTLRTSSLWDTANTVVTLTAGTYRPIGGVVISNRHWATLNDAQKLSAARLATFANLGIALGYMESDELAKQGLEENSVQVIEPDKRMLANRARFLNEERDKVIHSLSTRWHMKDVARLVDAYIALNAKCMIASCRWQVIKNGWARCFGLRSWHPRCGMLMGWISSAPCSRHALQIEQRTTPPQWGTGAGLAFRKRDVSEPIAEIKRDGAPNAQTLKLVARYHIGMLNGHLVTQIAPRQSNLPSVIGRKQRHPCIVFRE